MNNKLIPPDAAADQAENAEPEIETYRPDYCSGNDPYVVILDPPPHGGLRQRARRHRDLSARRGADGRRERRAFRAARKPTLTDREARTSRRSSCERPRRASVKPKDETPAAQLDLEAAISKIGGGR
jgi:hypothetical protein